MKVIIFDNDMSTLDLLRIFLTNKGHQVMVFPEPHLCSLKLLDENQCPSGIPCADAVIVNIKDPTTDNLKALKGLTEMGCKICLNNKAVMSACLTDEKEDLIRSMGFHYIKKPFRLNEILKWLDESVTVSRNLNPSQPGEPA